MIEYSIDGLKVVYCREKLILLYSSCNWPCSSAGNACPFSKFFKIQVHNPYHYELSQQTPEISNAFLN